MIELKNLAFPKIAWASYSDPVRKFMGSLIIDKWTIQNNKKLFYDSYDLQVTDIFRVLDEEQFEKYKPSAMKEFKFEIQSWVVREFFDNKPFTLKVPVVSIKDNTDITTNVIKFFLKPLAQQWKIDDLLYNVYRQIFLMLRIYANYKTWEIGFWNHKWKDGIIYWGKWVGWADKFEFKELTLEEVLEKEIEQWFISESIWDPNRRYWYTHLLREHAKFRLTNWWKNVLMNRSRYNIIATSRGQWKTFLAWYIAVRWLLDPRPWFWWRSYREIKVFVPNFEVVWAQMMKYIKMFIWDLADKKLPNKQKLFNIWAKEITCNLTWNVLQIISLFKVGQERELWLWVGEWVAADLAIIDEAARIPDSFWQSFHQRAAFETQEFFLISTINKETPADHWFYKLLLEWEAEEEWIKSYRVDIDNNEVMRWGKTEEQWRSEVEAAKETLREWGDIELYAKWYCIILDQSNVFNTAYATIGTDMQKYSDNDFRILWFDLAKLDDDAGLTIINLTHMEVESSIRKKNLTYGTQLENVQELKKQYPNLLVIWDRSGVWEAVAEQDIWWVVDVWIKSTWAWELKYNKQRWYYTCNKWFIINNLATLLSTNVLKIPQWNFDLITQMNNFVKIQSSRSETLLYKWKWKEKDDLVLSLAYASLYMSVILWIKNKDDAEKYVNEIWNNSIYSYNTTEEYQGGEYNYYNSLY